jgi:hypothetical protein
MDGTTIESRWWRNCKCSEYTQNLQDAYGSQSDVTDDSNQNAKQLLNHF